MARALRVGDTVAWPTNAPVDVDPFTALTVIAVTDDGVVEVMLKDNDVAIPETWDADPSELVRVS